MAIVARKRSLLSVDWKFILYYFLQLSKEVRWRHNKRNDCRNSCYRPFKLHWDARETLFISSHFFSSRSHLLLRLSVVGVDQLSKATTSGSLTLVDLAGSERISRSEATGSRLVEAAAINKSLSALGQVGEWTAVKSYRAQTSSLNILHSPCMKYGQPGLEPRHSDTCMHVAVWWLRLAWNSE